jgi:hypothetical protein
MAVKPGIVAIGDLADGLAVIRGDKAECIIGPRFSFRAGRDLRRHQGAANLRVGVVAGFPKPLVELNIMGFLKPLGLNPAGRAQ